MKVHPFSGHIRHSTRGLGMHGGLLGEFEITRKMGFDLNEFCLALRVVVSLGVYPTTSAIFGNLPPVGGNVVGVRPFLLYHSGFHFNRSPGFPSTPERTSASCSFCFFSARQVEVCRSFLQALTQA